MSSSIKTMCLEDLDELEARGMLTHPEYVPWTAEIRRAVDDVGSHLTRAIQFARTAEIRPADATRMREALRAAASAEAALPESWQLHRGSLVEVQS